MQKVARIPGVAETSPQVYLESLYGAACCAVSEMFLVVFDPKTDFAVEPWLQSKLGRDLVKDEVIGGSYVFVPPGEKYIRLYGYDLTLKGNLEATGTGLDQSLFMTTETALNMAKASLTSAESSLQIEPGSISSIMVKITPGADRHRVALDILSNVPGVTPIESQSLFGAFRTQMTGLLWGFFTIMIVIWALSAVLIGLVFSMAANERRREIAVLRALGATRNFIFRSSLLEAILLALGAGTLGIALAAFIVYLFRDSITRSLGMPFLFPSLGSFALIALTGIALTIGTVTLAAFLPSFRISREEPALAMRE